MYNIYKTKIRIGIHECGYGHSVYGILVLPLHRRVLSLVRLLPASVLTQLRHHREHSSRTSICFDKIYNLLSLSGGGVRFLPVLKYGVSATPAPQRTHEERFRAIAREHGFNAMQTIEVI